MPITDAMVMEIEWKKQQQKIWKIIRDYYKYCFHGFNK